MPGTICPIYVTGKISPLTGFTARRPCAVVIGRNSTGGLPPHFGSNFSKLKTDDSPVLWRGMSDLYIRRLMSTLTFECTFHVSCTYQSYVVCRRPSPGRPIASV